MQPLATLRTRFADARGPSALDDVFERVRVLESLYEEFRAELDATDPVFREERRRHWRALQERLAQLDGS